MSYLPSLLTNCLSQNTLSCGHFRTAPVGVAQYPGLLTPVFVTCSTNVRECLVKLITYSDIPGHWLHNWRSTHSFCTLSEPMKWWRVILSCHEGSWKAVAESVAKLSFRRTEKHCLHLLAKGIELQCAFLKYRDLRTICKDDLPGFVCRKCTAGLDKFSWAQTEAMKLKTKLANAVMDTTRWNSFALQWGKAGRIYNVKAGSSKLRIVVYNPKKQNQPVVFTALKHHQAETPWSDGKPPWKRTKCFHPKLPAYQLSILTARCLFGNDDDCEVWSFVITVCPWAISLMHRSLLNHFQVVMTSTQLKHLHSPERKKQRFQYW